MLHRLIDRYRTFFRAPDLVATFALTWLARIPIATVTLAMLLHVRALTDSFASAGAAVGAYMVASACTAPAIGRWVDRRGPALVFVVTGTLCPLALFAILAAKPLDLGSHAITALAAVAGAFAPPITVLTRTSLRHRFTDERDRTTAFAIDTVLIEMAFTVGPLILAFLLATFGPTIAFAFACTMVTLATPAFIASPAPRYLRREPDARRHLLGPLTEPRLWSVYFALFLITFTFGLIEVAYPAYGMAQGSQALGAVLIAANAVGSGMGGLVYGGLHLKAPPARQLPALLALMIVPLALQALLPGTVALAALAVLAGLLIAPSITVVMMLISTYAPARYATEAFTWSSTCIVAGIGAGAALGGRLVELHGPAAPFVAAALAVVLALVTAITARSR